jgi:succinoglycan biosynthesis protein ExoA
MSQSVSYQSTPLVSIIIPARNEEAYIEACLRSILTQDQIEGDFEILLLDGRSNDDTREIAAKIAVEDPRIRLLDNPKRVSPAAMNIGIQAARGEIIIRMDAHTEYAPDYLKQCVQTLRETGADNVGGPHRAKGDSLVQKAIAAVHHSAYAVGGALSHNLDYEGLVDTVIYGCWRKETFLKIGLYDEEMVVCDDDELNLRLTRSGGRIWQSPRIKSWYHSRSSLRDVFRQYRKYGYYKVRVIQKHHLPASWRHLVPGIFVIVTLITLVLLPWVAWAPTLLLALISGYGLATLVAAVRAGRRWGWHLFPIMPLIFVCFHFGYGLGFLRGVIDFIIFRRQPSERMKALTR